jgi:hypothetical protein
VSKDRARYNKDNSLQDSNIMSGDTMSMEVLESPGGKARMDHEVYVRRSRVEEKQAKAEQRAAESVRKKAEAAEANAVQAATKSTKSKKLPALTAQNAANIYEK